ncbi:MULTISPECIES: beta/gamma crystallin family protein [unclassified Janthinobacterium]|uniref:beta/gamma crystallin family protein n=1 Tax=unclassified Janthinobacterium TaxID=2610881 RepID=UPI001E2AD05B|nr:MULTISPECIES: beta/gamma crystallin family protein [unclassified Janthinobacterium]MCC7641500.1 beta/gamma crystallin family protein [Janthinobacterium sp. EB271-G4-3-1]MCC7690754.1 beta/gamma crystallin family protein [Janthinobacterium sp. EB271-G4-3-2]
MLRHTLNCALLLGAAMTAELAGAGELTLYSRDDYHGRSQTVRDTVADLEDVRFNDTTQSIRVRSGRWEACEEADFRGDCFLLEAGEYPSLDDRANKITSLREVRGGWDGHPGRDRDRGRDRDGRWERDREHGHLPGRSLGGELTFYTRDDFAGRSLSVRNASADLRERDFNDTVQSVRVRSGYWEVCEDVGFRGRCRTLEPGEYASLERMSNRISSVREVR